MYSIFHPLDVNERLPRELILEGKRHRMSGIRLLELGGIFYLPALILTVVMLGSFGLNLVIAFGVAGLLLVAFFIYAVSSRYR